jgi:hypothetical protein
MKILIISDSHGYGLSGALSRLGNDIEVKTVSVSSIMENVWKLYQEELYDLQAYRPDQICLHMGHNDVVWHAHHNPQPKHPKLVQGLVMGYQVRVQQDFPVSEVWVSCLFPRTVGPKMDQKRVDEYNHMVYQYGCEMRETFPPPRDQVLPEFLPVVFAWSGTSPRGVFSDRWAAPESSRK